MEYDEYKLRKRKLENQLADLVVPGIESMKEAGKLLENLAELWTKADLSERRRILMTMLEAVYVECRDEKQIVAIKAKPAFKPLFQIAITREESDVAIIQDNTSEKGKASPEADDAGETIPCLWWRRGSLELPVQKNHPLSIRAIHLLFLISISRPNIGCMMYEGHASGTQSFPYRLGTSNDIFIWNARRSAFLATRNLMLLLADTRQALDSSLRSTPLRMTKGSTAEIMQRRPLALRASSLECLWTGLSLKGSLARLLRQPCDGIPCPSPC